MALRMSKKYNGMTLAEERTYEAARAEREAGRAAELEAKAKADALNKNDNERLRNERAARREAEQTARREADEKAYERSVEHHKPRLAAEWLSAHPDRTMKDFESIAWPHLVREMREADNAENIEALRRRYRAEASDEPGEGSVSVNWSFDQRRNRARGL